MKIFIKDVCKQIKGNIILDHVNLELTGGRIYGFVGRNGSGKTMLFRAVSGLMNIDSGEITYDGNVLHREASVLPDLGMILENAGLYPNLTGFENLRRLADIKKKIDDGEIRRAIERVGLDPADKRVFRKYSLGMKQRIVIAQAIMESPAVLLLDEPTNALDDQGVEMVRQILAEEKKRGALIMIASHNRDDIELLADEVYRVADGKITRRDQ